MINGKATRRIRYPRPGARTLQLKCDKACKERDQYSAQLSADRLRLDALIARAGAQAAEKAQLIRQLDHAQSALASSEALRKELGERLAGLTSAVEAQNVPVKPVSLVPSPPAPARRTTSGDQAPVKGVAVAEGASFTLFGGPSGPGLGLGAFGDDSKRSDC